MEHVLETIVEKSRIDLARRKRDIPESELAARLPDLAPVRDFSGALRRPGISVIAELKKASPSKGVIRPELPVEVLAPELESAGASALSILTEEHFFRGSLKALEAARSTVDIPLLRKDFIYDKYQILEARVFGADAVLLIAAMLSETQLKELYSYAQILGLSVLCESHTQSELRTLLTAKVGMIGVNARNLHSFDTSLAHSAALLRELPAEVVKVAESAIGTADDIRLLAASGADAFLIGETLMRAASPGDKLRELLYG